MLVHVRCEALVAIVFAAMTLENFIYRYAIVGVTHEYYIKHIDKLSVPSKWVVVTRIMNGKELNEDDPRFVRMRKLIKTRNEVVHVKGSALNNPTPERLEKWFYSDMKQENDLRELSIKAPEIVRDAVSMIEELDTTEGCKGVIDSVLNQ